MHMPTRQGLGIILFAAVVCFGPMAVMAGLPDPLPGHYKDIIIFWYILGGVALVTTIMSLAGPKGGYHPQSRTSNSKEELS